MAPARIAYAPVRNTEGREWIDFGNIQAIPELCSKQVTELKRTIPEWDKANPVARIAKIIIAEA